MAQPMVLLEMRDILVGQGCRAIPRALPRPRLKRSDLNLDRPDTIASLIDHTLLKPDSTRADIARVCAEARQASFASVCINPFWVRFAKTKSSRALPSGSVQSSAFRWAQTRPKRSLRKRNSRLSTGQKNWMLCKTSVPCDPGKFRLSGTN